MTDVRQEYDKLSRIPSQVRAFSPRLDPLQARAAAAFAAVGMTVLAAVSLLPFTQPLPLVAAIAAFGVPAAVALAQIRSYHPHDRFGGANAVTLVRLGGAAAFAALAAEPGLLAGSASWAALGAALALLSLDGIDGWFARRERLASPFGARFDMEVDALLILVLAAIAVSRGDAPPWALGLGLVRYAFVAAGWLWPRLAAPLPPSLRRKTVCVVQVVVLTTLLAPVIGPPLSGIVAAGAFAALIWSFAVDIRWLLARRPA